MIFNNLALINIAQHFVIWKATLNNSTLMIVTHALCSVINQIIFHHIIPHFIMNHQPVVTICGEKTKMEFLNVGTVKHGLEIPVLLTDWLMIWIHAASQRADTNVFRCQRTASIHELCPWERKAQLLYKIRETASSPIFGAKQHPKRASGQRME